MAATCSAAIVVALLATLRDGMAGIAVTAAAAATIVLAVWLSTWVECYFERSGRALAALMAPMVVRMTLPLTLALTLVTVDLPQVVPRMLLYLVPIYLVMLAVETVEAVARHDRTGRWATAWKRG